MDAMVTARMPQGKKDAATDVLRELGTSHSQFINDAYDYIIKNRRLPLSDDSKQWSEQEIRTALAFIDSIPVRSANEYANMSTEEIKRERMLKRGLMTESDFE